MQVKIGNVLAMFLLSASLWVFFKMKEQIIECLGCAMRTGVSSPDKMTGAIAVAVIVLGVVSSIRLILEERRK